MSLSVEAGDTRHRAAIKLTGQKFVASKQRGRTLRLCSSDLD